MQAPPNPYGVHPNAVPRQMTENSTRPFFPPHVQQQMPGHMSNSMYPSTQNAVGSRRAEFVGRPEGSNAFSSVFTNCAVSNRFPVNTGNYNATQNFQNVRPPDLNGKNARYRPPPHLQSAVQHQTVPVSSCTQGTQNTYAQQSASTVNQSGCSYRFPPKFNSFGQMPDQLKTSTNVVPPSVCMYTSVPPFQSPQPSNVSTQQLVFPPPVQMRPPVPPKLPPQPVSNSTYPQQNQTSQLHSSSISQLGHEAQRPVTSFPKMVSGFNVPHNQPPSNPEITATPNYSMVQSLPTIRPPHLNTPSPMFPLPPLLVQPSVQQFQVLPPCIVSSTFNSNINVSSEIVVANAEDLQLKGLLKKFAGKKNTAASEGKPCTITVVQYRALLRSAFDLLSYLSQSRQELASAVQSEERLWNDKVKHVMKLQSLMHDIYKKLSNPEIMSAVMAKLQRIKKKREWKRLKKHQRRCMKKKREQNIADLHQEIDKFHNILREKNLTAKREEEMKKEADNILSEVRRKIYEAKRTIEKLKVFEKLRQTRRENAIKKGMFILPKHDRNFDSKVSMMKEAMQKQLSDYEAEERALKVMLETEHEEEAQSVIRKLKDLQEDSRRHMLSCLFGESEQPLQNSPMHFFWQHHNAGNSSLDSLLKIRHAWDMHLVPRDSLEGSSVPQQWVTPKQPSSDMWSNFLDKKEL